ncbi:MAG: ABC transporter ATP-binding protein [Spirochaetales bacterium]|nr:ABC transporter ATP-binding protein [Spirochaetales bacterium]
MSDAVILEAQGLNKHFGGLHAVRDVWFSVQKGKIKSIIGPNGAGKTTLFNLLSGAIPADSGRVMFKGELISSKKPYAIAALGMARTYQTTRLFEHMTVLENIMAGRHIKTKAGFIASALRLPWTLREESDCKKKSRELLTFFSLGEFIDETAQNLAFGIKRKVECARACALEPDILLLDEPAAGLNIYETKELSQLICRIRDLGITILLVEHDMSMVMDISDEILVLNEGAVLAEGLPREIQKNPDVIRVYLGEDEC